MSRDYNPLGKAFTEDHRHLTRGFWKLKKVLEAGDMKQAREIARDIDECVGPHIEFEETLFYPALRQVLGDQFVDQLYREHTIGKGVIMEIIESGPEQELSGSTRKELVLQTRKMLDHAISCGTLLSHLEALDPERQKEFLQMLEAIRARGAAWSRQCAGGHIQNTV